MADAQQLGDQNLVQREVAKQLAPANGEPLPDEMERPTVLCRFGCIFLDLIVLGIPVVVTQYMAGMLRFPPQANPNVSLTMKVVVTAWGVALGLVYFGTMHGAKGQTLGKMAGKIKVVNLDGTPITMSKAYLRALCYSGPNVLAPLVLLIGPQMGVKVLSYVGGAYFIVNVIMALADRNKQRALHDCMAGTRVITIG